MSELTLVLATLQKASCPEDVFGNSLKRSFRQLLRVVHPDRNPGNPKKANEATERLNYLNKLAEERVTAGTYGKRLPLPENTPIILLGQEVLPKPIVGDVCDVYIGKKQVVKVARNATDNDLMRAERSALQLIETKVTTMVRAGFPKLLEESVMGAREVNIIERMPAGFVTALEAHHRMPSFEGWHLVWMFKRLLMMLDWTHHLGLVHGAILPPHLMLYPDNDGSVEYWCGACNRKFKPVFESETLVCAQCKTSGRLTIVPQQHPHKHTVRLLDWCYSVKYAGRTRLSSWLPMWALHYPPELTAKQSIGPSSDLYMAAALVLYLAGRNELPKLLLSVLSRCMDLDPKRRYQRADETFSAWQEAARVTYGPPKWVDFNLPEEEEHAEQ